LVLARRPGEFLLRMDPVRQRAMRWHRMESDRYLGGHAVLAHNARSFFTSETDGETGQGLIAERDLLTLEKHREFPSGGIGPHALVWEPGGTLLVANGGILNLPETGRRKLNLNRMESNLTRLDIRTGTVLAQFRLSDPYLGLRHLALATDGTVGVALQAEHPDLGARSAAPALALLNGDTLRTVAWTTVGPPTTWDGYAADITWAAEKFWLSAPRAGWIMAWNAQAQGYGTHALAGASALATFQDRCLAGGEVAAGLYADTNTPHQHYGLSRPWDNHAALLPLAHG
jgi:hypothetical protein